MLSIQQVIKTLRKLQNNCSIATTTNGSSDLLKSIRHVTAASSATNVEGIPQLASKAVSTAVIINVPKTFMTSRALSNDEAAKTSKVENELLAENTLLPEQHKQINVCSRSNVDSDTTISCSSASTSCSKRNEEDDDSNNISSQLPKQQTFNHYASHNERFSLYSPLNVNGSKDCPGNVKYSNTQDSHIITEISTEANSPLVAIGKTKHTTASICQKHHHQHHQLNHHHQSHNQFSNNNQRSQRIQNFFRQQIFNQFQQFHTQPNKNLQSKHKQTQFAMSSLAAEPLVTPNPAMQQQKDDHHQCQQQQQKQTASSCDDDSSSNAQSVSKQQQESKSTSGKPCFNSGLGDIIQFMELIGNLKHTKRTGWVLRDINDCESISGHMYRMSILTFLLDGSEGLNQIRCMELALVHDLAESLVGDITPFCGISKEDKKAMELKAMEDICKLIEPRGKRIMELFEEYENGQSPESRFVKDLDRLDMVMQAYEYEKRDNCLLKHQEFFDSTEGKFKHPFVKKLVGEIYEQREKLAKAKGATPPPKVDVPNMDDPSTYASKNSATNGHHENGATTNGCTEEPSKTS